jgi:cell division protein FtsQ
MKKWLNIAFWITFAIGASVLMAFANTRQNGASVGYPEIEIEVTDHMLFLTKDQVIQRLIDRSLIAENKNYAENDIAAIETEIQNMPEVKSVHVYSYVSGKWKIDIQLRRPVARIFNLDSSSCYLDEDGFLMPLSETYTARVLTVNGYINETNMGKNVPEIMNNDSLKTIEILDDLYAISQYVCSDEFLSAQITHVFINQYHEFELIPRVGDQRILFGDASHVKGKFKKLEYFYSEGISRAGWENYDTINLMNRNQVVTSKR